SCHGSSGKGDGPIVHFLKRKPKDLTQLSISNDGVFPFERIWGVFDGSYAMEEHGSTEMPIWGYKFIRETQESGEPNAGAVAKSKALDIILYLQIIQE
ncbi:MAG: cytochrome C, partial [Gammaproteobacteria bacterium]